MTIIYEPKSLEWTSITKICNTNNHTKNDKEPGYEKLKELSSEEYIIALEQTNKNFWSKYFPDSEGTIIIPLPTKFCKILLDASIIGYLKNDRPKLFDDELLELEKYIDNFLNNSNIKYFARINAASPKDGMHSAGPLLSSRDIVNSLTTSLRVHKALNKENSKDNEILYLVPWKEHWNENLEFRVFVHKNKITCVSQYIWSKNVGWNSNNIQIIGPEIIDFVNNKVIGIIPLESYVVDIIVVTENNDINNITNPQIEIIEFNSFGAELASGSALFHWLNDYDIMYGIDNDNTIIRYVEN